MSDSLTDLLLRQLAERPDAVAVVDDHTRLTYRELVQRARAVARSLQRLGIAADSCVGILIEPSVDLAVAVWGTLFAGGAYLPLSPEYPAARLAYMVEDSRATVVLTQEHLRGRQAGALPPAVRVVTLDEERHPGHETPGPRPDDLAYVIYTSGSTGKPKGVMIDHRAITSQLRWLRDVQGLGPGETVLQKTPSSFDAAQWEILAAACGSRVVMGRAGLHRDADQVVDMVKAYGVTVLQCVPTLLQGLLDTEALSSCGSLRRVYSGGEALARGLAARVRVALPTCDLINLYGPTECTINSSAYLVGPEVLTDGPQTVSIGSPVTGTRYHVLDGDLAPVAVGEVGELYVGGVQLARGYLHRPDLTAERFIRNPAATGPDDDQVLYRTGDLVHANGDGTLQYVGRIDNQVKLRGFRIELDEIRWLIERHHWVKSATVVVRDDPRPATESLTAFIELDPREAALMDQGDHGTHHQSKSSRLQVRSQLADPGLRTEAELAGRRKLELPGRAPTDRQWREVFARKTYRFFEGGEVSRRAIERLLARRPAGGEPRAPGDLPLVELGALLRHLGQFHSPERLLPKYGYASPGALYATQLFCEIDGIAGLDAGLYYYHPARHHLTRLATPTTGAGPRWRLHLVGRRAAIRPVYRTNIDEVLEIECGHLLGLLDEVLPRYGLGLGTATHDPSVTGPLGCAADDHYLGTFDVVPYAPTPGWADGLDVFVQAHPGRVGDLPAGQYRLVDGRLERVCDDIVERRHVIAINQQVYDRASFGVSLVHRGGPEWLRYVALGRALHALQANDDNVGLMSSGYSSRTGHDLPSARRLAETVGADGPSYFVVGGRVSDEQVRSAGMKEDSVHMKGPAEMIKDQLAEFLPDYMMPNRVVVLDRLPLTANGKVDRQSLVDMELPAVGSRGGVPPHTPTERRVADVWRDVMGCDAVSVHDDFFAAGGNSMLAVAFVNRINREFECVLPLQALFEAPTVEAIAARIDSGGTLAFDRIVPLRRDGRGAPVFCWPGLGGYPMNLRPLADRLKLDRPFYGVQAYGLNPGEAPYAGIGDMAAADERAIRRVQPTGPYTLWGYSFGARVAFEVAHRLEAAGERVDQLVLIAPGNPRVGADPYPAGVTQPYRDPVFLSILFSVFASGVTGPLVTRCRETVEDEAGFVAFVVAHVAGLDADLVRRIVRVVVRTYRPEYDLTRAGPRPLAAPVTVLPARGDQPSPFETRGDYAIGSPVVVPLNADHYGLFHAGGVDECAAVLSDRLDPATMPRVGARPRRGGNPCHT